MSRHAVILSPHFDDAVLSCWHVLARAGEVLVVNVFAAEPAAGALGWWDRHAGAADSARAVRTRIEEDRQPLALAGRTAVKLPFLDGQYRHGDQAATAGRRDGEAIKHPLEVRLLSLQAKPAAPAQWTASVQSRRRSENCGVAALTSTTTSAGTFALRAAARIASGDGAS